MDNISHQKIIVLVILCVVILASVYYSHSSSSEYSPGNVSESDIKSDVSEPETDTITNSKTNLNNIKQISDDTKLAPPTFSEINTNVTEESRVFFDKVERLEGKTIKEYANIAENELMLRFESEDTIWMRTNSIRDLNESEFIELVDLLDQPTNTESVENKYQYSELIQETLNNGDLGAYEFDQLSFGQDVCALSIVSYNLDNEDYRSLILKRLRENGFKSKMTSALRWKDANNGTDRIGLIFSQNGVDAVAYRSHVN